MSLVVLVFLQFHGPFSFAFFSTILQYSSTCFNTGSRQMRQAGRQEEEGDRQGQKGRACISQGIYILEQLNNLLQPVCLPFLFIQLLHASLLSHCRLVDAFSPSRLSQWGA